MISNSEYDKKGEEYFYHTRSEIIPFVPDNIENVLDIGCGSGNFGALLKEKRNCIVYGVEPMQSAAEKAKSLLNKVYISEWNEKAASALGEVKFDCIFFNDVLEHLIEPEEALLLAKTLLTPEGYIIASIPNIRWYPVMLSLLRYKDFKYTESGVMDKTHLRFFTPKSMRRLFENTGYQIECLEGINKHRFIYLDIANILCLNMLKDMYFPQYLIRAKANNTNF